jgi:hypothetical protein
MNDSLKIDNQLFDDLVSGQLTGQRYRAALRALDAEPAKWRDCALAFLEEQALRAELTALASGTIVWTDEQAACLDGANDDAPQSAAPTLNNVYDEDRSAIDSVLVVDRKRFRHPSHWLSSSGLLSTAALLLVSFSVGWLGSDILAEREQTSVNSVAQKNASIQQLPIQQPAALRPAARSNSAPHYVFDQPGGFVPLDRGIPRSFRELERQGKVRIESLDGLMPATLSDGSPALIPVQEIRLVSSTYSY